nr:hypothetical protein [Tanacetum cinerariifolium]
SISEEETLELVDPQEFLGSVLLATNDLLVLSLLTGTFFLAALDFLEKTNVTTGLSVLLSIGIGSLRGTVAVVAILVKGHTFPTNVKVRPVGQNHKIVPPRIDCALVLPRSKPLKSSHSLSCSHRIP